MGAAPAAPAFAPEDLLRHMLSCSPEEKRLLAERLLRHLLGDQPGRDYCIPNPDGSPFVFVVPSLGRPRAAATAESLEDAKRLKALPADTRLFSETVARLQAMQAWQDLPDMQDAL
jgi:hypothetical protein